MQRLTLSSARLWNVTFAILRLVLLQRFLHANHIIIVLFGLSELVAVLFTFAAVRRSVILADHISARIVPILYCLPLLLTPSGFAFPHALACLLGFMVLQVVLRCYMGLAVTVGVPNYQGLLCRGPYAYLRHPLAACEIAIVCAFTCAYVSIWNVIVTAITVSGFVVAARMEERFLLSFPEYRAYASRVRWRFFPLGGTEKALPTP